jgi:hypothetical protein
MALWDLQPSFNQIRYWGTVGVFHNHSKENEKIYGFFVFTKSARLEIVNIITCVTMFKKTNLFPLTNKIISYDQSNWPINKVQETLYWVSIKIVHEK